MISVLRDKGKPRWIIQNMEDERYRIGVKIKKLREKKKHG